MKFWKPEQLKAYWARKKAQADEVRGMSFHPGDVKGLAGVMVEASPFLQRWKGRYQKGKGAISGIPEHGRSILRTGSAGGHYLDRALAGGINLAHTAAESILAHHIDASATRLRHQVARLAGMSQKHMTESAMDALGLSRMKAQKFVGPLTDRERELVANIHREIRVQMHDLDRLRELRRTSDKTIQAAARSALAQMKAKGAAFKVRYGDIDDEVLAHAMRNFVGADTPEGRERVREQASELVRFGG